MRHIVILDSSGDIEHLAPSVVEVAECITSWPNMTKSEICTETGRVPNTVRDALKALREAGLIVNNGTDRRPEWQVDPRLRAEVIAAAMDEMAAADEIGFRSKLKDVAEEAEKAAKDSC